MNVAIHRAAEDDILRQAAQFSERGLSPIARRFHAAALRALEQLAAAPTAGVPQQTSHLSLHGLHAWPIKGFADMDVYYCILAERISVLRVLHRKRDLGISMDEAD